MVGVVTPSPLFFKQVPILTLLLGEKAPAEKQARKKLQRNGDVAHIEDISDDVFRQLKGTVKESVLYQSMTSTYYWSETEPRLAIEESPKARPRVALRPPTVDCRSRLRSNW